MSENNKKVKIKFRYWREIGISIFLSLILLTIFENFFLIATIPSTSMSPVLEARDKVYINRNYGEIKRGNIYTFEKDGTKFIKRCIGIGGDHIVINNDDVFVNGVKDSYATSRIISEILTNQVDLDLVVPEGTVFFLGDNRKVSYDARYWNDKFVPTSDIIGEADKIVYPFNRITSLNES